MHLGLTAREVSSLSTRGNPANANRKLRPRKISSWRNEFRRASKIRVGHALCVPPGDVRPDGTGWAPELAQDIGLHLTAVRQLLAFTIQSIQLPTRRMRWRDAAATRLDECMVVLEEVVDNVPEEDIS